MDRKMKKKPVSISDKAFKIADITSVYGLRLSLALLFAVSFIYLYWWGEGIFFYQENRSLFIFSGDYLRNFITKPGGLLSYAAIFLTQGYFSPAYGSLLNSIIIVLICLTFKSIVNRLAVPGAFSLLIILLPSVLLLLLQAKYEYHLQHTLGFFCVVLWFLVSISSTGKYSRLLTLLLFPFFWYLVGSYALVYLGMYITYCFIYINDSQKYLLPLFLLGYTLLTYILFKEIIFFQPLNILLGYPLIFNEIAKLTIYLVIQGVLLIIYPFIVRISGLLRMERITGWIQTGTVLIFFPIMVLLLVWQYNSVVANVLKIEKNVHDQDWDSVISQYEKTTSVNIVSQYFYNLALSEKGQLCNRMFSGLQSSGPLSISLEGNREQAFRTIYFYYSIGLVNEAHHLAYELMVQHGYTPENIKMLIKTELIKGNFRIAERYLNVLKKTLHYKNWALRYEKLLHNPQLVNSNAELGEKIMLMPKKDFFITTDDSRNIDLLLNSNPGNKKAFEYKMARLLLEKDIIAVVNEVIRMKELGYTSFPRHIEEAVVAYRNYSREPPELGKMTLNPETEKRFIEYGRVLSAYKGNKALIQKAMKKNEKNTFWYYLQFSTIKSDFWKRRPEDRSIY